MRGEPLEITDLLWDVDRAGARRPVIAADAVARLTGQGQRRAARLVARMPVRAGRLDERYVDALGFRVHAELQRLTEELQFGHRAADLLRPILDGVRARDGCGPLRVVDVGCGLGFVLRWLASVNALGPDVELVGVDLNPVLIEHAATLAEAEGLGCRFVHGDAFTPNLAVAEGPRTVIISSGLLHHLPAGGLPGFFAAQAGLRVAAFVHWDIAPCLWSTLGAWVFHRARMREPVSRHDGVLSARRAHSAEVLLAAARAGAPGYRSEVREGGRWHPRALDVLRPLVALGPILAGSELR